MNQTKLKQRGCKCQSAYAVFGEKAPGGKSMCPAESI